MDSPAQPYTNQLIHESSPYLLQHAHNPVNWYAWGEDALARARKENKLLIISIGYAACHWCHVMEHESFEDEEVARFMNNHFVAIKVDREERPDIDQIYMNAVELVTGGGGWPLNCIALPDGRPLYGGTYFPKADWLWVLAHVSDFVKEHPDQAEAQAQALTNGIQSAEIVPTQPVVHDFSINDLDTIFNNWKNSIDLSSGGQKGAPKFPLPVGYRFLLYYHYLSPKNDSLKAITVTLEKMADGGIYDHIGGGFSRYSTDTLWKVPHFEKMLYDNAQLVSLYAFAYQKTGNHHYKSVVTETLECIERELTSDEGGFYSSLDADSDNEEGKFYVWTTQELKAHLGDDAALFMDYYSCTPGGNWEKGNNILWRNSSKETVADAYNITTQELATKIANAKQILLVHRSTRTRPGCDDKILTSWNALMIKAYCDAYRVFDNPSYLERALGGAAFITNAMVMSDGGLLRNYKNGKASISAFLDDYAFTIDAWISLYQATFDERWLHEAHRLTEYTLHHFFDPSGMLFFYTSNTSPQLIARTKEIADNVIPSSNSAMALNLFTLGHYFYNNDYIDTARAMLSIVKKAACKGGTYFANWDMVMAWFASKPIEIALVGANCHTFRKELDKHYLPNVLLSGGAAEGTLPLLQGKLVAGQTTLYLCRDRSCQKPETDVTKVLSAITTITQNSLRHPQYFPGE